MYTEMVNIVNDKPIEFTKYKFLSDTVRSKFDNFSFNNARPITKAMITWWAFQNDKQPLLSHETVFEVEHIYAKSRYEREGTLTDPNSLESLGNKVLLEKRINIRASDLCFCDKGKYYKGFTDPKGRSKSGTAIVELVALTDGSSDFTENDIVSRYNSIMDSFIEYLGAIDLIK